MYHNFYQFKENPFNVTADPDFFFSSKCHTDAISNLIYGIEQRKGIMVVTGEVGTGKTTLCRKLLKQSSDQFKFALILNPNFTEIQLLQMIVHDLGIQVKSQTKLNLIYSLNQFLLTESNLNQNIVLIIDESQNLSINQLEKIRLLSNIETEKEKLLQIILVGQPELYEKLQSPALRQLRQRVAVHFHLQPLDKNDIKEYIHHRIKLAVGVDNDFYLHFTDAAIDSIFNHSKGSPRTINILCDRALLAGFIAETYSIDHTIIETCAKEVLNW